jgi:hypothetical protein
LRLFIEFSLRPLFSLLPFLLLPGKLLLALLKRGVRSTSHGSLQQKIQLFAVRELDL